MLLTNRTETALTNTIALYQESKTIRSRGKGCLIVSTASLADALAHLILSAHDATKALGNLFHRIKPLNERLQASRTLCYSAGVHLGQTGVHIAAIFAALVLGGIEPMELLLPAVQKLGIGCKIASTGTFLPRIGHAVQRIIGYKRTIAVVCLLGTLFAATLRTYRTAVILPPALGFNAPVLLGCAVVGGAALIRGATFMPTWFRSIRQTWFRSATVNKPPRSLDFEAPVCTTSLDRKLFPHQIAKILDKSQLPMGELAEEHVLAMLYQAFHKRDDVMILNTPHNGNFRIPEIPDSVTFVVMPLSVGSNSHNTAVVLKKLPRYYVFSYLNSSGGALPQNVMTQIHAGFPGRTMAATSACCTTQTDEWSCGLHVVENVINTINELMPSAPNPSGQELYDKHAHLYASFMEEHRITQPDRNQGRLHRRQKKHVMFALREVLTAELKKINNPELQALLNANTKPNAFREALEPIQKQVSDQPKLHQLLELLKILEAESQGESERSFGELVVEFKEVYGKATYAHQLAQALLDCKDGFQKSIDEDTTQSAAYEAAFKRCITDWIVLNPY